jgi:hypothetical protein
VLSKDQATHLPKRFQGCQIELKLENVMATAIYATQANVTMLCKMKLKNKFCKKTTTYYHVLCGNPGIIFAKRDDGSWSG